MSLKLMKSWCFAQSFEYNMSRWASFNLQCNIKCFSSSMTWHVSQILSLIGVLGLVCRPFSMPSVCELILNWLRHLRYFILFTSKRYGSILNVNILNLYFAACTITSISDVDFSHVYTHMYVNITLLTRWICQYILITVYHKAVTISTSQIWIRYLSFGWYLQYISINFSIECASSLVVSSPSLSLRFVAPRRLLGTKRHGS